MEITVDTAIKNNFKDKNIEPLSEIKGPIAALFVLIGVVSCVVSYIIYTATGAFDDEFFVLGAISVVTIGLILFRLFASFVEIVYYKHTQAPYIIFAYLDIDTVSNENKSLTGIINYGDHESEHPDNGVGLGPVVNTNPPQETVVQQQM